MRVWKKFGGEIWGYWCSENKTAIVGKSTGGHDFVLIDDRFLVDAWAAKIEGLPIPTVMDLATKEGTKIVRAWYGLRSKWVRSRTLVSTKPVTAASAYP